MYGFILEISILFPWTKISVRIDIAIRMAIPYHFYFCTQAFVNFQNSKSVDYPYFCCFYGGANFQRSFYTHLCG